MPRPKQTASFAGPSAAPPRAPATEGVAPKRRGSGKAKAGRKGGPKKSRAAAKNGRIKHRSNFGVRMNQQGDKRVLRLPKTAVRRMLQAVMFHQNPGARFSTRAARLVQEGLEHYLVALAEQAYFIAKTGARDTLGPHHIDALFHIRGVPQNFRELDDVPGFELPAGATGVESAKSTQSYTDFQVAQKRRREEQARKRGSAAAAAR
jgi:histone H3/H4